MKLLIIGGSGFVSGTLARVARAAGHQVWTITRGQRPAVPGVSALAADRQDSAAVEQALASTTTDWDLAVDCIGCLPEHGRDPRLLDTLRAGQPLRLVGGGHFRQQPILARDLATLILSIAGNAHAHRQIFNCAGPDVIESREYYRLIAEVLGVELKVAAVPVCEVSPFLCHRIYDLGKLQQAGLAVPATRIAAGLREHTRSLLSQSG